MATETKSEMQKHIEGLATENFTGLKALVDAEQRRRSGEADRAHTMNANEFADWKDRLIEAGDKARRARDQANG